VYKAAFYFTADILQQMQHANAALTLLDGAPATMADQMQRMPAADVRLTNQPCIHGRTPAFEGDTARVHLRDTAKYAAQALLVEPLWLQVHPASCIKLVASSQAAVIIHITALSRAACAHHTPLPALQDQHAGISLAH
jgi:hypothetical protein